MIDFDSYIKPSYKFKEVYELQKLPLLVKIEISVEVLRRAFELSKHNIALAFSGGKDSQVVADLTGTGLENEYDAEVMISPDGQLSMI